MTSAVPGTNADDISAPDPARTLVRASDVAVVHEGARVATPAAASLSLAAGEVVLLLGPSGSGKSTLALTLNGLIPHAVPGTMTGHVDVDGRDAATTSVAELSTRVGMVFQDPDTQLVTGTVLDEVAFGPENLRRPVEDVLTATELALRQVGLWERRHENPDRLSGGGKQRLAIACALAMGSPVLVLDEPTANLDPAGIEEVYATLADVVASGERALLLIEHNLDAAIGITDRVVVLDDTGRTFATGTVDEVLRAQADALHAMGVWLPVSTIAALRLRDAGWEFERLPLTPEELHAAIEASAAPAPAAPTGPALPPPSPEPTRDTIAPPAVVQVRGLSLLRRRVEVLHDIDLTVRAGEFVAVVGANGAGKTSLIQAIAGVIDPPRDTVRVGGVDPARAGRRHLARRIGFVFQNPEHQFIAHTVFDELAHGLRLQKLPEEDVRERTLEILRRFGLEDHADRHPFLLSGGQKRRLSVGTALVAGAPILALDEPTFGQDRARADELLRVLRGLNEDGTTLLVVTHDMQLVTEYATRTVVVADGRIIADASTHDVFADDALLRRAGLRPPPLRTALRGIQRHPEFADVTRIADLPGGAA